MRQARTFDDLDRVPAQQCVPVVFVTSRDRGAEYRLHAELPGNDRSLIFGARTPPAEVDLLQGDNVRHLTTNRTGNAAGRNASVHPTASVHVVRHQPKIRARGSNRPAGGGLAASDMIKRRGAERGRPDEMLRAFRQWRV